jgi:hypothetical protein
MLLTYNCKHVDILFNNSLYQNHSIFDTSNALGLISMAMIRMHPSKWTPVISRFDILH